MNRIILTLTLVGFCIYALLTTEFRAEPFSLEKKSNTIQVDINSAIRIGSGRNFNLRSIRNRAKSLNGIARESYLAYLPSASVSLERTRAVATGDTDSRATEVRLNLEQVVYDGGQRDLALTSARLEKALLKHEYRRDAAQLGAEIQSAFLAALAARGKIVLNRRSLVRAREQMRLARLEEKAGFTTRTEVYLVAARLRQIELALKRAENAYTQALYELKLVMNLEPEISLEPRGDIFFDFIYDPPSDVDIRKLVYNARTAHPEVMRSHANVYRRLKEKQIADNSWIPRLTVGGYMGRSGESFPVRNRTWGVNFAVTFPFSSSTATSTGSLDVSDNGNTRSGTNVSEMKLLDNPSYSRSKLEARTAYARARSEHKQLSNRVVIDVQRRFDELQEAWKSIRLGNGRVYFQMASLRIARKQFEVGQSRRAEILRSEVDLVQAQEDLTDDLASYLSATYALELAAAVDPGSLGLYEYDPGSGNTLLARMIEKESTKAPVKRPPDANDQYFDDSFEIDKIKIDEDP